MILRDDEILDFIPQRPPIVMVDGLVSVDDKGVETTFNVSEDNIFCEGGVLKEPGLIEHVAQSAAVRIGYLSRESSGPVPIGLIGGVNKLKVHSLPKVGSTLKTKITIDYEVLNATVISAEVRCDEQVLLTCSMKIFIAGN
ncbi:hydroxymyristoyl-ACP dehydratase [Thermodesulfobacteriota bacterium]